jgi:hypothetical protein
MTFFTESSDEKIFLFFVEWRITLFNELNRICCINCMTYFGWIAKDRSDIFPIDPPGFSNFGILVIPLITEDV